MRTPESRRMITLEMRRTWMAELLLMPKSRRPWVRNYTIRATRPELGEVDIEFALHGDTPASTWARHARPGDPAGIFDMGVSYLPPPHAERQLLAGDESAVPAILAILEHAPASLSADVILEVPTTADIRPDITAPEGARVHWLARDDASPLPGTLALQAAKDFPRHRRAGPTPGSPEKPPWPPAYAATWYATTASRSRTSPSRATGATAAPARADADAWWRRGCR
ncbi:siderophore-interacting protein [Streptomyces himastatinicus]|uniref:siderophore-interacting protein n=1 Tax=Streptomyces himastatinicus TaxID=998084 RepID=UPI0001B4C160